MIFNSSTPQLVKVRGDWIGRVTIYCPGPGTARILIGMHPVSADAFTAQIGPGGYWDSLNVRGDISVMTSDNGVTNATLQLLDDGGEIIPTVSGAVISVEATEPSASETPGDTGLFTFTRSDTAGELTANFNVSGTATNGVDYLAITGSVTFPDGQATATVTISPVQDFVSESTETVILTVLSGSGYYVGFPNQATVNITNVDLPSVFTIYASDANASPTTSSNATVGSTNLFQVMNGDDYYATNTVGIYDCGSITISRTGNMSGAKTITLQISGTAQNALAGDYSHEYAGGAAHRVFPSGSILFGSTSASANLTSADLKQDVYTINMAPMLYANNVGLGPSFSTFDFYGSTAAPDRTAIFTIAAGTGYTVGTPASATVTLKRYPRPVLNVVAAEVTATRVKFTFTHPTDPLIEAIKVYKFDYSEFSFNDFPPYDDWDKSWARQTGNYVKSPSAAPGVTEIYDYSVRPTAGHADQRSFYAIVTTRKTCKGNPDLNSNSILGESRKSVIELTCFSNPGNHFQAGHSAIIVPTIPDDTSGAITPPTGPTDLTLEFKGGSSDPNGPWATLAWTNSSELSERIEIERSTDGTTFVNVMYLGPDATAYPDPYTLDTGTHYWYRVRAVNRATSAYVAPGIFAEVEGTTPVEASPTFYWPMVALIPDATAVTNPPWNEVADRLGSVVSMKNVGSAFVPDASAPYVGAGGSLKQTKVDITTDNYHLGAVSPSFNLKSLLKGFSLLFWYKRSPGNTNHFKEFAMIGSPNSYGTADMLVYQRASDWYFAIGNCNPSYAIIMTQAAVHTDNWQRLIVTWDKSINRMTMRVGNGSAATYNPSVTPFLLAQTDFHLGTRTLAALPLHVAQVMFFREKILGDAEATADWASRPPTWYLP